MFISSIIYKSQHMGTYFMSNRCTDKVMIPKYIHIYNGIVVDYLKKNTRTSYDFQHRG